MNLRRAALATALSLGFATPTWADTAATKAYAAAMNTMMDGMMVPATGKPDLDFTHGMIPHHQGAVDMAKVELHYGKDAVIRKFAEAVVSAQTAEIKLMQEWVKAADQAKLVDVAASKEANMKAMDGMMQAMDVKPTGDADKDFVIGMIPHHQGAVAMAKTELDFGKDETMRKLAADIVKAQEAEITMMQDWLKKHP